MTESIVDELRSRFEQIRWYWDVCVEWSKRYHNHRDVREEQ